MHLLLVEDDRGVARFIKKGLEAERYSIDVAIDGEKGLKKGLSEPYDLIILDLILPVHSGIEICRTLRDQGIKSPILILTAKDTIQDKLTGFETGADDYLTKPFAFEELLARIRALLRRPTELDFGSILEIADLVLDKNRFEVTRAGKPVELTATEYALLEYLMRHPNRVLSRTVIRKEVWHASDDPSSNVVDVYIRRLRHKIDLGFERQLIHTVRSAGYTLKA
jgi:DNA-binding response OmpR family regulator